jgi:hypothetical protein
MKAVAPIIVLLLCASCAVFAPDRFGYKYRDGAREAADDLAAGVPKIKVYGLWEETVAREYFQEARRQFGVEADPIALCIVDDFLVRYAAAYNAVIKGHMKKVYGRDVLAELYDSVRARHQPQKTANQAPATVFKKQG